MADWNINVSLIYDYEDHITHLSLSDLICCFGMSTRESYHGIKRDARINQASIAKLPMLSTSPTFRQKT